MMRDIKTFLFQRNYAQWYVFLLLLLAIFVKSVIFNMMRYADGRAMIGHFGFNTEYINQVFLLGTRTNVTINRIFTIPDTLENEILVMHLNEQFTVKTPAGNNFELYLSRTLQTLQSGNYEQAYHALLSDAKVKQMIFNAIK